MTLLPGRRAPHLLVDVILEALDASINDDLCSALEEGRLAQSSTASIRSELACGRPRAEELILRLQNAWRIELPWLGARQLATVLRVSTAAIQLERSQAPRTQIVWTGPRVDGSFLRSTREVVREIINGARREVWVVGYWLAGRDDGEGIIAELIALLAAAAVRDVAITMVMDERPRPDGTDNRTVLLELWPQGVATPRLLTWRLPPDDHYLKLHAKVVVADRADALVTSANLTSYAMDRNIEFGIRVIGEPAGTIAVHLALLERAGTFEEFLR